MKILMLVLLFVVCTSFSLKEDYPIDGYESTGICRLKRLALAHEGKIPAIPMPKGALKKLDEIQLNLLNTNHSSKDFELVVDEMLQKQLMNVLPAQKSRYSLSILDITVPNDFKYAQWNEKAGYQPGSVGKLVVVTALFNELQKLYPNSWEKRIALLKKPILGGKWVLTDEHTIPIYNVETQKLVKRQAIASDVCSLYEWIDHTLSVSNNGAASVVWREALLMNAMGQQYITATEEEKQVYFTATPRIQITDLAVKIVNEPLRNLGISEDEWRLGSFFTKGANAYVGDKGGSIGTTIGVMKWMLALEQGNIIDQKSSLEIKRLMYMTDRRIRYAQAPELKNAAVFFKSGSLYKCDRTLNPSCGKYMGNVYNYMNSVAIIEHDNGAKYMVCLMSNVLNKNSASDHLSLASRIDGMIQAKY